MNEDIADVSRNFDSMIKRASEGEEIVIHSSLHVVMDQQRSLHRLTPPFRALWRVCLVGIAASALLCLRPATAADLVQVSRDTPLHRRPVAVRQLHEKKVVIANRRSGTLSIVDTEKLLLVDEFEIGGQPSDISVRGQLLFVTDAQQNRLVALHVDDSAARFCWEVPVPANPLSVRIAESGEWCSVCSSWARKVVFVGLPQSTMTRPTSKADSASSILATINLPFSPREQIILEDSSRLVVADAFGDYLAVIRLDSFELESVRKLPGNNIRGLALSNDGQQLYVSHEVINEIAPPRSSEIIWGGMLSDALRALSIETLIDPTVDLMKGSRFITIGNGTRGAGDPDAMAVRSDGRIVIALAGTNEVGVIEPDRIHVGRVPVGRRPVAISRLTEDRYLVVNEQSDSISRLDFSSNGKKNPKESETLTSKYDNYGKQAKPTKAQTTKTHDLNVSGDKELFLTVSHLSLGSSPKPGAVERGEALFFDARLSRGGWYSCHSCHTDGHTSGSLADTLSDGGEGAPKRILSLLGAGQTGPWAWLGDKPKLDDQVRQTLLLTMQGRKLSEAEVDDLTRFVESLEPPPPFHKAESNEDRKLVRQGRKLFRSLNCKNCHSGKTFTSDDTYDVGLTDELGSTEFNPPSLRGVGHLKTLFHDQRASDLHDVVSQHQHQLPRDLNPDEQAALVRYLQSL